MATLWFKRIFLLAVLGCTAAPALAQNCPLDEVEINYRNMRLPAAIDSLNVCRQDRVWNRLGKNDKLRVFRLLAFSYHFKNEPDVARMQVQALMQEEPRYRPATTDPEFFQVLVREFTPPKWYQKRRVQVVGGVLIGAAALIFALTRPEGPQSLPGPPLPGSN